MQISAKGLRNSFFLLPHRQAWQLAWPMTLSNISNPLMGMADTAMLGHLPDGIYLGAVAIGANIMALLFWMLAFLRMGTTSFVGRHYGSGDDDALLKHLGRSIGVALTMGLSLIALQWVLINLAVLLIAPNAELSQLAHQYCTIRIYGAPAVLLTYIAIGTLIGLQNTRLPLLIAVASNALNIGLDYLFIVRFNWLSAGAAYATLIAEYSACALAIYLCIRLLRRKLQQLSWQQLTNGLVDWPQWRKLLSLNSDLFIRTGALLFVFNFFTAQSGRLGEEVLAANAILMQFVLFIAFGLDGYAHAVEAMGARSLGQGNMAAFLRACGAACSAALAVALTLTLVLAFGQSSFISIFTDNTDLRLGVAEYFGWIIMLPLVSVWTYLLDGIFIGAGQTRLMRNWMLFSVLCCFLPLWWLTDDWQNHGLWASFTLFNLVRGASLARAFYTLTKQRYWF